MALGWEQFEGSAPTYAVDFTKELIKLVVGTKITAFAVVATDSNGNDVTSSVIAATSFTDTEGRFKPKTTAAAGVYDLKLTVTLDIGDPLVDCAKLKIKTCPPS